MEDPGQADPIPHPVPGNPKFKLPEFGVKILEHMGIGFQPDVAFIPEMEKMDGVVDQKIETGGGQILGGGLPVQFRIKFRDVDPLVPGIPGKDKILGHGRMVGPGIQKILDTAPIPIIGEAISLFQKRYLGGQKVKINGHHSPFPFVRTGNGLSKGRPCLDLQEWG